MPQQYNKTVDDDLDWSMLDQLHAVVLQIGTFCFRTKQVCLTLVTGVVGLIATFHGDTLDSSVFVAGALIPTCFWFLDSIGYYYQVKLRGIMDGVRERIQRRHSGTALRGPDSEVIANERTDAPVGKRLLNAFFNHSMWIYLFLFVADIILFVAFAKGWIQ